MRTRFLLLGLLTLASVACTGGHCGTEGGPGVPACADHTIRELELDEATSAGTARSTFKSAVSLGPQTAGLRWRCDAGEGYLDTTVTLSVSGEPTSATLGECAQRIQVEGAVLRFQSADGAFDETVAGVVSGTARVHGKATVLDELMFEGQLLVANFAGTYDVSRTSRFNNPRMIFSTSLSPVQGTLYVGSDNDPHNALVASWDASYAPKDDERGVGGCFYGSGGGSGGDGPRGGSGGDGPRGGCGGGAGYCSRPADHNPDTCAVSACAGGGGCYLVPSGACDESGGSGSDGGGSGGSGSGG